MLFLNCWAAMADKDILDNPGMDKSQSGILKDDLFQLFFHFCIWNACFNPLCFDG